MSKITSTKADEDATREWLENHEVAFSQLDMRSLAAFRAEARREVEEKAAELRQALGLLTTQTPKVVMDADHPLKMAQGMVAVLQSEREVCERIVEEYRKRARSVGGVIGTAAEDVCERILADLRERAK
jgi:uncharacterized protein YecE (DUF72 family)